MAEAEVKWLPYRPSNGTEGDFFRDAWCDRCERDRDYRENGDASAPNEGGGLGCAILARTMGWDISSPNYPKEWVYRMVKADDGIDIPEAKCLAFEPERPPVEEIAGKPISVAVRDDVTGDLFG